MSEQVKTEKKEGAIEVFMGGAKKGLYIMLKEL